MHDSSCCEENLVGLVVAFYEGSSKKPSEYFFLGHVTEASSLKYDESKIRNPVKVTSLNGEEYYYFGLTRGDIWKILLEDPFQDALVVYAKSPAFCFDIVP